MVQDTIPSNMYIQSKNALNPCSSTPFNKLLSSFTRFHSLLLHSETFDTPCIWSYYTVYISINRQWLVENP